MKMSEEIMKWAIIRGLECGEPSKQMLKLGEEYGELCEALAKNRQEDISDAVGDMVVVLTVLCLQLGLHIDRCVDDAYQEIKDRRGKMVNGVFVKEEDLI